jgi:hypothetical protein
MTIAYEYGPYEESGCVLEVSLRADVRWAEPTADDIRKAGGYDNWFRKTGNDAMRCYGGNVWVLWNPRAVLWVRRLAHPTALELLVQAFDEDGSDCAYNGIVNDYAAVWWGRAEEDTNLKRMPDHRRALEKRLNRHLGRNQSLIAA